MNRKSIIKTGTFGKIVVPEDNFNHFDVQDGLEWYENDSITFCLTAINLLRQSIDTVDILDIGSDPGYFSIPFAKHAGSGVVYSYRTTEDSYRFLSNSIELNQIDNIKIIKNHPTTFIESKPDCIKDYILTEGSIDSAGCKNLHLINTDSTDISLNILKNLKEIIHKNRPVIFQIKESEDLSINNLHTFLPKEYYIAFLNYGNVFIPKKLFWKFYYFIQDSFILDSKKLNGLKELHPNTFTSKINRFKQSIYKFRWKFKLLSQEE